MEFITSITVAFCVSIAPMIATYRSWSTSSLSALVAAIYALTSALIISNDLLSLNGAPEVATPNISYQVVSAFYGYLNTALLFAFVAILLLIRERLRPTVGARLSTVLFWLINLGTIANILSIKVLTVLSVPRRYVDYEGAFLIPNLMSKWALYTVTVSVFSLLLIVIFSALFGRRDSLQTD